LRVAQREKNVSETISQQTSQVWWFKYNPSYAGGRGWRIKVQEWPGAKSMRACLKYNYNKKRA
jgi:hypothetical protein